MKKFFELTSDTFLLLVLVGLVALPVLVAVNLTPEVQEEEPSVERREVATNKQSDSSNVLGARTLQSFDFNEHVFSTGKMQVNNIDKQTRNLTITMGLLERGVGREKINLGEIVNSSNHEAKFLFFLGGDQNGIASSKLEVVLGERQFEAYNGQEGIVDVPSVTLQPGQKVTVGVVMETYVPVNFESNLELRVGMESV